MSTMTKRLALGLLLAAVIITISPQPVEATCKYCHFQLFVGWSCLVQTDGAGKTMCTTNNGGCSLDGSFCEVDGGGPGKDPDIQFSSPSQALLTPETDQATQFTLASPPLSPETDRATKEPESEQLGLGPSKE